MANRTLRSCLILTAACMLWLIVDTSAEANKNETLTPKEPWGPPMAPILDPEPVFCLQMNTAPVTYRTYFPKNKSKIPEEIIQKGPSVCETLIRLKETVQDKLKNCSVGEKPIDPIAPCVRDCESCGKPVDPIAPCVRDCESCGKSVDPIALCALIFNVITLLVLLTWTFFFIRQSKI